MEIKNYNNAPNLADEDIYLDITIHNPIENTKTIPASFQSTRDISILSNQKDYKMSVIRLDIPIEQIQKFLFEENKYSITLSHFSTGITSQQYLILDQVIFNSVVGNNTDIYYYKQIIKSCNDALELAFNDIINQYNIIYNPLTYPPAGAPTKKTFITYNAISKLFTIHSPVENTDSNPERIEFYMNYNLSFLFETIMQEKYGFNLTSLLDSRIIIRDEYNNRDTFDGQDYYLQISEFENTGSWYNFYHIILVSEGMHCRKENFMSTQTGSRAITYGVVADFSYSFQTADDSRIQYVPTSEFRFTDLLTEGPLKFIDFELFVQHTNATISNIHISPGQNASLKILFRKK